MVLLDKLWDDVVAGPSPDKGLGKLRKVSTKPKPLVTKDLDQGESSGSAKLPRSVSMPETPKTPVTPNTPGSAKKPNVWRSVFNPGSNLATKKLGANLFDSPQPNSPTVYDWLYSSETRSNHR